MTEFKVTMHSIEDVRKFVSEATRVPVDIDVTAGRYTVNGKSILGLFSLVLVEPELGAPAAETTVDVCVYGAAEDGMKFKESLGALVLE